jgi:hypothetical protein
MNTNWSQPKTNILSGMLDLRQALAAGLKAKLIRARNEDCLHPIRLDAKNRDFRAYEFQSGYATCIKEINLSARQDFSKYLTLNYVSVFGTPEAVKKYYTEFQLSKDNFQSVGKNHLVHVDDLIKYLERIQDFTGAERYRKQYRNLQTIGLANYFDFYKLKQGISEFELKKFKKKLWVVALLDKNEAIPKIPLAINILNVILKPFKYVPKKHVLKMPQYTLYDFRIGSITNGFKIEFQIPKKFSFNK